MGMKKNKSRRLEVSRRLRLPFGFSQEEGWVIAKIAILSQYHGPKNLDQIVRLGTSQGFITPTMEPDTVGDGIRGSSSGYQRESQSRITPTRIRWGFTF